MKEKLYCIYKHTSPSGKSYIGQTNDYKTRCHQHQKKYSCPAFRDAIDKYTWDNFSHEILEENLTLEEANIFEELYITEYNTLSPNGYNLTTGGLNYKKSEETCKKISESILGKNHWNFGKCLSEETKEKLKNTHIGELNPNFGKFGKDNQKSKKYIITFPDGHEEFIIGLCEFCRNNNLHQSHMSQIANGKGKQHKGFKCRYYIEDEALDIAY